RDSYQPEGREDAWPQTLRQLTHARRRADRMRRRAFMALLAGAATWPLATRGQQPAMTHVGFLSSASPRPPFTGFVAAVRHGLNEGGYVEGRNLTIEYRWAENQYGRLPELAADLVRQRVAVIVASGANPRSPQRRQQPRPFRSFLLALTIL